MRCEPAREALSAQLDGELPAGESAALEEHLGSCPGCREWRDAATTATRRARLRPALPPRDLAASVLAAAPPAVPPRWHAERFALVAVGAVMLLVSLAVLLGGGDRHVVREAGVTDLALAVGVLTAAWQPWRAAGMLPVVVVLAAGLTLTSAADVLSGAVAPQDEALHALAPAAALLLWRLRRRTPAPPAPAAARRLAAVPDERRSA